MLGLRRGRGSRRRGPRCQGSSRRPRVLAVDDVLLFDEREAFLAFDLLAHAGEDQLAGPALLGNEIGDPARALRLLPNPSGLQELIAPSGPPSPRPRNRRPPFPRTGIARPRHPPARRPAARRGT